MDKLLKILILDQKNTRDIYKPSKYWKKKSISAVKELKKNGLNDFRSSNDKNIAATGFGDGAPIDGRRLIETSSLQNKLGLAILNHTPLKKLFDWQVNTTRNYLNKLRDLEKSYFVLTKSEKMAELVQNYKIKNSINFGCDRTLVFNEQEYSKYYLNLVNQLNFIEKNSTLKECRSLLEIGPGFGANIHLIEQNYSEIRKFIVIDIVPNVWVVTNYLRSLYGNCVKDYLETKDLKEIKFKDDTSLEIFVIPPWEIEKISSSIDCFWNSNSFVEMQPDIVSNYANYLSRIKTSKTIYTFISYDKFDINTTFHPDLIQEYFSDVEFQKLSFPYLFDEKRKDYFYLGKSTQV
tara:strand:+ start:214 stop:1260 length:1047 start_codon:yes stop_codon:yes gene_type:complete